MQKHIPERELSPYMEESGATAPDPDVEARVHQVAADTARLIGTLTYDYPIERVRDIIEQFAQEHEYAAQQERHRSGFFAFLSSYLGTRRDIAPRSNQPRQKET